jgi:hypothetical protein
VASDAGLGGAVCACAVETQQTRPIRTMCFMLQSHGFYPAWIVSPPNEAMSFTPSLVLPGTRDQPIVTSAG